MKKKLILCAPFALLMASCSSIHMSQMVPESRDTDFGAVRVQGFNTGSVITYGKNYKTGYMETANVTVFRDSGIDNTAKLAHAAGSLAGGTGSVLQGYGAIKYAKAHENYARAARSGALADRTNIHVEGSSASANGGSGGSGGNASASGGAGASSNSNSSSSSNSNANATANTNAGNMGGNNPDPWPDNDPWPDTPDDNSYWDDNNQNNPDPVWGGGMMGGGPGD
jgi:hypothetical protein